MSFSFGLGFACPTTITPSSWPVSVTGIASCKAAGLTSRSFIYLQHARMFLLLTVLVFQLLLTITKLILHADKIVELAISTMFPILVA